jgi:MFS family permease
MHDDYCSPLVNFVVDFIYLIFRCPPSERSTAAAIYTSGHQIASLASVWISSKLCLVDFLGGWPLVFYFFGACGVFAVVLFLALMSNRPEESRFVSQQELNYIHDQLASEGLKKKHVSFSNFALTLIEF